MEPYQTCPICGWIEDLEQNADPKKMDGKNKKSFEGYFKDFLAGYGMYYCAE